MSKTFLRHRLYLMSIVIIVIFSGCEHIQPNKTDHIAKTALFVSIEMRDRHYKTADTLTVKFTFRNTTKQEIRILKWNTPLEGFSSNFLDVIYNGKKAPYIGKLIRRGPISADDFVIIKPGKAITVNLNLEKGYRLKQTGSYEIFYNPKKLIFSKKQKQNFTDRMYFSKDIKQLNRVKFFIKKRMDPCGPIQKKLPPDDWQDSFPDSPYNCGSSSSSSNYIDCTPNEKSTTGSALSRSKTTSTSAFNDIVNGPHPTSRPNSPRYTTWFGHYNLPRWNTVLDVFDNMQQKLNNETIRFDCSCDTGDFAYVYANQTNKIWLCNLFWSTTDDERVVTIIHEASHWNDVGSTDDYAYGRADAQALADTNSDNAVNNAENYGYFALNNPYLSMHYTDPRPTCDRTEDCPAGQVCRNGRCTNANFCANHSDCSGSQICYNNRCVVRGANCQRIIDCPNGQYCIDNSCVSRPIECFKDKQCGDSAFCINNLCYEY